MLSGKPNHRLRLRRSTAGLRLWLCLATTLLCCSVWADQIYVVKRGDTLTAIARRFKTTPDVLSKRNSLEVNARIYPGQKLKVPGSAPTAPKPRVAPRERSPSVSASGLASSVQRSIDRAPVKVGRWKYIVIHHSGVDTGTMKGMDAYHRNVRHMENGLAYHFVIGNGSGIADGQVVAAPRWTRQLDGGHLASEGQNKVAIGICLVGNFDRQAPSARQMQSLRALANALLKRCQLPASAVRLHQEINVIGTRCPGNRFPKDFARTLSGG